MSLISTSDLRVWMGIEEGDTKPNAKLLAISSAILDFVDSFTNRHLEAKRYLTDPNFSYRDGNGKSYIYLPQYPISYVSSCNVDGNRSFASGTLIASADLFWYPNGKVALGNGYAPYVYGRFSRGRRNILFDYTAGYAPVVGGTWNSAVSTYPVPQDLKQTIIEMSVESFKEGMTAVHTVQGNNPQGGDPKFIQMLSKNSFWANVLNKYKAFDNMLSDYDEEDTSVPRWSGSW